MCTCTRGRNGRNGKAENCFVEERSNNIFIFFVSVLAMTTTLSVSSVIRFVRYIYNIGGRTKQTCFFYLCVHTDGTKRKRGKLFC